MTGRRLVRDTPSGYGPGTSSSPLEVQGKDPRTLSTKHGSRHTRAAQPSAKRGPRPHASARYTGFSTTAKRHSPGYVVRHVSRMGR